MTNHSQNLSGDFSVGDLTQSVESESSIATTRDSEAGASSAPPTAPARRTLAGRLHYFWSLCVAASLLLVFAPPAIIISRVFGRRHWVYPWALFGRASGCV
jgi:hypothetical protein